MHAATARLLAVPALLAGLATTFAIHQPGDHASAYSDTGSAIYSAVVVATTTPSIQHRNQGISADPVSFQTIHTSAFVPATIYDLRSKPSISVDHINQILSSYGSPMAGQGQVLYDLGVKYGIDPAFCLAFFVHESGAGTQGEAAITHSVGNIRVVGNEPSRDGYRYYDTWTQGAEDWYRLISNLYITGWGLTTVERIIPVYAPSGDNNNTSAYIDDVEQLVGAWRAQGV